MKFNIIDIMKKPTIEGKVFYVETLEDMVDEYLEELNMEDDLLPTGKTPRERFCATSMMMRAQRT